MVLASDYKGFADSGSANLVFICNQCGRCGRFAQMSIQCPTCSSRTFRVARTGRIPTFNNPLKDPYKRDVEEDGPNLTTPGGEGTGSSSGFGQNSRGSQNGMETGNHDEISLIRHDDIETPGNTLPGDHDGFKDDVDVREGDPLQSPAMSADNSPFNPINNKREPMPIGPFNMHKTPGPLLAPGGLGLVERENVFDRVRRKRKEALL